MGRVPVAPRTMMSTLLLSDMVLAVWLWWWEREELERRTPTSPNGTVQRNQMLLRVIGRGTAVDRNSTSRSNTSSSADASSTSRPVSVQILIS